MLDYVYVKVGDSSNGILDIMWKTLCRKPLPRDCHWWRVCNEWCETCSQWFTSVHKARLWSN